jgi:hypothetical protein
MREMSIARTTVADPLRTVEESQRKDAYDLQIDAEIWTKDLVSTQTSETTTILIIRMLVEISWRWRKTSTLLVNSRMNSLPRCGKDTAIPRR